MDSTRKSQDLVATIREAVETAWGLKLLLDRENQGRLQVALLSGGLNACIAATDGIKAGKNLIRTSSPSTTSDYRLLMSHLTEELKDSATVLGFAKSIRNRLSHPIGRSPIQPGGSVMYEMSILGGQSGAKDLPDGRIVIDGLGAAKLVDGGLASELCLPINSVIKGKFYVWIRDVPEELKQEYPGIDTPAGLLRHATLHATDVSRKAMRLLLDAS